MIKDYIKENIERSAHGYKIFNKPLMVVNKPIARDIDLNYVSTTIETLIPKYMFQLIEAIYIGDFIFFKDRQINALYQDNAIYINSNLTDQDEMIEDIVHELSHALEENYKNDIYLDDTIENEFLGKRERLRSLVKYHNYDVEKYDFLDPNYSQDLDLFFFKEVGYPLLNALSEGLFASAYGATSLREYFANGFEEYVLGNREYLKKISPKLYYKIDTLYNLENKNEY